jgi:hypothetical protein
MPPFSNTLIGLWRFDEMCFAKQSTQPVFVLVANDLLVRFCSTYDALSNYRFSCLIISEGERTSLLTKGALEVAPKKSKPPSW